MTQNLAPLVPGRDYEAWLAFNKPMRWRENGQVVPFPGRAESSIGLNFWLESAGTLLEADYGDAVWLNQPGGAPFGYMRYRDDAVRLPFTLSDSEDGQALIQSIVDAGDPVNLTVLTSDLTGQLLDADPSTAVDWADGAWTNYDSTFGAVDTGGADRSLLVDIRLSGGQPD
ncbi:MAG: hypothetical protein AAGJ52_10830, partial [Pseudomonadota bacterium]